MDKNGGKWWKKSLSNQWSSENNASDNNATSSNTGKFTCLNENCVFAVDFFSRNVLSAGLIFLKSLHWPLKFHIAGFSLQVAPAKM